MKEIQLGNGGIVKVDDETYGFLVRFHWYKDSNGYIVRRDRGRGTSSFYMHRDIMGHPARLVIDHINGDKTDNQINNLRMCLQKQNACNRGPWAKSMYSKYKGVSKDKRRKIQWVAKIMSNRKTINLGYFEKEEEAALAYNEAARKYHGEFALLNEI